MNLIEPGLLRVFKYFTAIAMLYFAALVIYGQFELIFGLTNEAMAIQAHLNLITYITLFGYLNVRWFRRKLGRIYLPIAVIFATATPIFSNLIYLVSPDTIGFSFIISRSWLLFPILLIPLVIIAWQYPYIYSILYIVIVGAVELSVLFSFLKNINFTTLPILGVPIIQGFAFGIVSNIIDEIVNEQRVQKKRLIKANVALSEYADTMEQLAITRERNRLARELHDTLAHTLSGLSVNLEAIKIMLNSDQSGIQTMLDHALENTRVGLDETRRTLRDLRPKSLEDLGLRLSLIELVEDAAQRGEFTIDLVLSDDIPHFSFDAEKAIFRIVQEAFQNIVLHSNAKKVWVESKRKENVFCLSIRDDGKGFSTDVMNSNEHFGIPGMIERAEISGGKLDVESKMGEGTIIHLSYEMNHD
ncbi:MAG: sensor histidine kinase [Anaerolineales bacterium]|jgi:signal transduction histidine kinase